MGRICEYCGGIKMKKHYSGGNPTDSVPATSMQEGQVECTPVECNVLS